MSNGKFNDFGWHMEYHGINNKKKKAADCYFLSEDRICDNTNSLCWQSKCFDATHCNVRIKEKDVVKEKKVKINKSAISKPKCNLELCTPVIHKKWGKGKITKVEGKRFFVMFDSRYAEFIYPDAFENGFLKLE